MQTLNSYIPSRRISASRLWRLPLIAVPLTIILGWAYALALQLDPPFFIAPFVSFFLAKLLTVIALGQLEKVQSRSPRFNGWVGFCLAGLALWVRWVVTFRAESVALAQTFVLSDPVSAAQMIWQYGVDRAARDPGAFSPAISAVWWLLEAGFVVLLTHGLVVGQARKPFSETLRRWAVDEKGGEVYLANVSADELRRRMVDRGVEAFTELQRAGRLAATPLASTWSTARVTGHRVEGDPDAFWLTVEQVDSRRTDEGKTRSSTSKVIEYWRVSAADYLRLMNYLHEADDAAEPAAGRNLDPAARPTPDVLKTAVNALERGDADAAIDEATPQRAHPSETVRADAHRVIALAHSRRGRWGEAYEAFSSLFALEPSAHNALQLATTSVMHGEMAQGASWYSRAVSMNDDLREMALPAVRTAYLSALERAGQFEACEPPLAWLRSAYESVGHTDSHLLWSHGLPPFGEFLARAGQLLKHTLPPEAWLAWFEHMRPHLDAPGGEQLDAFLAAEADAGQAAPSADAVRLYEHVSRGNILTFDPNPPRWMPLASPDSDTVTMHDCAGRYLREEGVIYAAYWTADRLMFRTSLGTSIELLARDEGGAAIPLHAGLRLQFEALDSSAPQHGQGYSKVSIVADDALLFSTTYCAGRYAHMAAMDFTAASMLEDLADWDFFVWLAREVAGGAQRDVQRPHSGMLH
ncbi:tetratricopeptide repeat protein [Nitrogeniibacter aestuarii]|uniref:tetratricopeptide repeat protein n=1 Tax=Nitrogeniibacter aestuarii TaxID=2815343 RepID=UPI001D0F820B|nr:hypothetical protein [Nitrogeniibacter aestuarii]